MMHSQVNTSYQLTPRPGMRRFLLEWDNSKVRSQRQSKYDKQVAEGVKFSNGRVVLDNGSAFETQGEMEHLLGLKGTYQVDWIDE